MERRVYLLQEYQVEECALVCRGVRGLLTPRTGAAGGEQPPQDSQEPDS